VSRKKLCPECNDIPMKLNEKAKSASYCRVCYYRIGEIDSRLSRDEKRKQCKKTYKGCRGCKTLVCDACFPEYEHNFIDNKSFPNVVQSKKKRLN
jgi:hypothetical protein